MIQAVPAQPSRPKENRTINDQFHDTFYNPPQKTSFPGFQDDVLPRGKAKFATEFDERKQDPTNTGNEYPYNKVDNEFKTVFDKPYGSKIITPTMYANGMGDPKTFKKYNETRTTTTNEESQEMPPQIKDTKENMTTHMPQPREVDNEDGMNDGDDCDAEELAEKATARLKREYMQAQAKGFNDSASQKIYACINNKCQEVPYGYEPDINHPLTLYPGKPDCDHRCSTTETMQAIDVETVTKDPIKEGLEFTPQTSKPIEKMSASNPVMWVLIVVFLFIAGTVGFLYFKKKKSK